MSKFLRQEPESAAPGIGIAIQELVLTQKVTHMGILFHKSYWKNGIGLNISHRNQKRYVISNTWQINLILQSTFNLTVWLKGLFSMKRIDTGKSSYLIAASTEQDS